MTISTKPLTEWEKANLIPINAAARRADKARKAGKKLPTPSFFRGAR